MLLTQDDIKALAPARGLDEESFIQRYTRLASNRAQLSLTEKPDGACVFLDDAGRCVVYNARPEQCRRFPFDWSVSGCPACRANGFDEKK